MSQKKSEKRSENIFEEIMAEKIFSSSKNYTFKNQEAQRTLGRISIKEKNPYKHIINKFLKTQ